ncbi:SRPBCC domain-containing protein [Nocardia paucivorans]|uniref:SRPBCC domain-containing protein n=1 Tax=Nocardia paucivorans TaxID=114259 RepID=UPI0002F8AD41|nr:SRPBCC domain-containing protein [Nocardia paucivorans]
MTQSTERLGDVLRDGDRIGVRYERHMAHPPTKVWRALTESEHLRHWFPADIIGERRAGADIRLRFWPESVKQADTQLEQVGVDTEDPVLPGRILTWDPPRIFEFLWDTEHLRFELIPVETGTRLICTVLLGEPGPHGPEGTAAGYHICLDALRDLLDTGSTDIPDTDTIAELERRYTEPMRSH